MRFAVDEVRGGKYWDLDGRTDAPGVAYDEPTPSRWIYPDDLTPAMTWTSWVIGALDDKRDPTNRDLQEGVRLAMDAHNAGKRVRIHPVTVWVQELERDEHGYSTGGSGTTNWIVEVFDAPIPDYTTADDEDGPED